MPTIQEEYARLLKMAETEEGYHVLEKAMLKAQNYVDNKDGTVTKKGIGAGFMTAGWAIDKEKLSIRTAKRGGVHAAAKNAMIRDLEEAGVKEDEARYRIIRVWASYTDLFELPLITIDGVPFMEEIEVQRLESAFIEGELGLPVSSIACKWIRIEREKLNSKRLKSKTVESR